MFDNGCRDFVECHSSAEHCVECRFPGCSSHLLLRSRQENGAMLQKSIAPSHLGRTHELPATDQDLPAHGRCKARRRTVKWSDSLSRAKRGSRSVRGQMRFDTQRPQGSGNPGVDFAVGVSKRTKRCNWRCHRVCDLVLVPNCLPTGWPPHNRDVRIGSGAQWLIATDRECGRIPTVQTQVPSARSRRLDEKINISRHVVVARSSHRINQQAPGRLANTPTVRQ
jgi:hypothetical protein